MQLEKIKRVVSINHISETLSSKVKKIEEEEEEKKNLFSTVDSPWNDYRCYYSHGQMLFVLSRPSPEHCKTRDREQEREQNTDRQTDCNTSGGRTIHEPPLYLMSFLDRQRRRPLPILHCSGGNYSVEDGELLKAT